MCFSGHDKHSTCYRRSASFCRIMPCFCVMQYSAMARSSLAVAMAAKDQLLYISCRRPSEHFYNLCFPLPMQYEWPRNAQFTALGIGQSILMDCVRILEMIAEPSDSMLEISALQPKTIALRASWLHQPTLNEVAGLCDLQGNDPVEFSTRRASFFCTTLSLHPE
jgi:hypothetical protein